MNDPVIALGNALIALNDVETHGRGNLDKLLYAMQQIEASRKTIEEAEKRAADNGQGENVSGIVGVGPIV